MKLFEKFEKNDEAVSPVIGVILMVAITVILAAVIAAFVFGMAGNMSSTKNVAATATQQGSAIIVTYQGGADSNNVEYLRISPDGTNSFYYYANSTGVMNVTSVDQISSPVVGSIPVGYSQKFDNKGSAAKDHVVVAAHFADGSDQVVLDTFV
ncbi:type IV pilin [Methanofollis formosanus]|uniref:Type IV pilin n=1 Tax=Methanofollis formosanus TaxID=299308 RepID=A0A8G0ZZY4_9EURY|nr:type IV pilin N-terminal domain-containing protein [Methanofollis formosanus]QYZ78667.1 type IV pilin [Methanofollis formosanus]